MRYEKISAQACRICKWQDHGFAAGPPHFPDVVRLELSLDPSDPFGQDRGCRAVRRSNGGGAAASGGVAASGGARQKSTRRSSRTTSSVYSSSGCEALRRECW